MPLCLCCVLVISLIYPRREMFNFVFGLSDDTFFHDDFSSDDLGHISVTSDDFGPNNFNHSRSFTQHSFDFSRCDISIYFMVVPQLYTLTTTNMISEQNNQKIFQFAQKQLKI